MAIVNMTVFHFNCFGAAHSHHNTEAQLFRATSNKVVKELSASLKNPSTAQRTEPTSRLIHTEDAEKQLCLLSLHA